MGRYGFRSGYVKAQNLQSGTFTFSSTESAVTVTYEDEMNGAPAVNLTPVYDTGSSGSESADVTLQSAPSLSSFTAQRETTGNSQEVHWVAMHDDL